MIALEIQEVHWFPENFLVNHGIKLVFEVSHKVKIVTQMDLESTQMLVNILIGLEETWRAEKFKCNFKEIFMKYMINLTRQSLILFLYVFKCSLN